MILASHNSMSYLEPYHKWLRPLRFMARCQSASLKLQHDMGVKLFDIRISYDKAGNPHFRHGLMRYKGNVLAVLAYLDAIGADVRLLLEDSRVNAQHEMAFYDDCLRWTRDYPNIHFYGGQRKCDWLKIYPFPEIEHKIKHLYASMIGGKIDDLFPKRYAVKNNRKNIEEYDDSDYYVMIDYCQYR